MIPVIITRRKTRNASNMEKARLAISPDSTTQKSFRVPGKQITAQNSVLLPLEGCLAETFQCFLKSTDSEVEVAVGLLG